MDEKILVCQVTYSQHLQGDLRTQQTSHEDLESIVSLFYLKVKLVKRCWKKISETASLVENRSPDLQMENYMDYSQPVQKQHLLIKMILFLKKFMSEI